MRHVIETAPRDGTFVVIDDSATGTYGVAKWLPETGKWVGKNGEPSKITPTHWRPTSLNKDLHKGLLHDNDQSSSSADANPTTWRRRYNLGVDLFAAFALIGLLFYVTRDAGQADIGRTSTTGVLPAEHNTQWPGPQIALAWEPKQYVSDESTGAIVQKFTVSRPAISWLDLQLRAEATKGAQSPVFYQQRTAAHALEAGIEKQELTASTAQQALDEERARSAALRSELATARGELEMQLRKAGDVIPLQQAEAARNEQLLQQERQKATGLAEEAAAARAELTASAAQHRKALDEEHARSDTLARELAAARRELQTQVAQLRKASDEADQLKVAEAANALLLEQERLKTATLTQEAAIARQELTTSTAQHHKELDDSRASSASLSSELATAQRQLEMQVAQLHKASEEAEQLRQAETASAQSLEREREKTAAFAREAAAARQAMIASSAQQRQALDEERLRRAALWSELAAAQHNLATQAAQSRNADDQIVTIRQLEAANSEQSLEQQRKKAAALAQEAAAARQELTESTAQHQKALEEERARNATLASELAAARRELEIQISQLHKVSDKTGQTPEAAEIAHSPEQERHKAAALAEAAAARQELTANAAKHRQAIDEERALRDALSGELATAQREVDTRAAQLRKANDETRQIKQAAESAMAELRHSLQQERRKTEALARDLAASRRTPGAGDTPEPGAIQISKTPQAGKAIAPTQAAAAEARGGPEATRLIARASALLSQGNIGAARTVLERAADAGSAQASFMLAETYDPSILSAWGTHGTRGEVAKARELYARAHAGGIQEAKDRLNAVRQ